MASSNTPADDAPTLETLVRALTPLVGPNMARSAARGQCEKLGLVAEKLTPADMARLVDALAPGLRVFVGRERTDGALAPIRRALGQGARGAKEQP
jgi:hypothetical protein